jgi:hypothetical protein
LFREYSVSGEERQRERLEQNHAAGTTLDLLTVEGPTGGSALSFKYSLGTNPSYVVIFRDVSFEFPANYEISIPVKGTGTRNTIEFKVGDEFGNTFLKVWRKFQPPAEWQTISIPRRELRFGWGPKPRPQLDRIARVELAVTGVGEGELLLGPIAVRELPPLLTRPSPGARASSEREPAFAASNAVDGIGSSRWMSQPSDPQWIEVDYGFTQVVAGARLQWGDYGEYDVMLSPDGVNWETVYRQECPDGGADEIFFAPSAARFLRIEMTKQHRRDAYVLHEIELVSSDEAPILVASSAAKGSEAQNAMDGNLETAWRPDGPGEQWLQLDLRGEKAYGGLFITWADDAPKSYRVELSTNGLNWWPVYAAENQAGALHKIYLKETESRFVRIVSIEGHGIRNVELKAPEEEMTAARFYQLAAAANPGCYPRWLLNQQAYWTLVGTPEDTVEGAICEDGTLEPHKRGFTIMPFLRVGDTLVTRETADVTQDLLDGCLPIPSVEWRYRHLELRVTTLAAGGAKSAQYARYALANRGAETITGSLFLVVHPIQVYPPWQEGHNGFAPIRSMEYESGHVHLDGERRLVFSPAPDAFGAKGGTFQVGRPVEGDAADDVARGALPAAHRATDADGFVSGAARYDFAVRPGETAEYFLAVPLHPDSPISDKPFSRLLEEVSDYWRETVSRVELGIPDPALVNMVKANVAYNLITRDGPGFQPGSRSYDKAWMRDGSIAALSMFEMGFRDEIREFIEWFAAYQFDTGEIPPIIDNKHEDPMWEEKQGLQEFDSQGQFVNLVREYYAYTRDVEFLVRMYPRVIRALEFLQALRERRDTPEFRDDPEKQVFHNILPPSRSHEGYWLAHSYWDDFWALKGWKDGLELALIMGDSEREAWMKREYETLKQGVYDTIQRVMKKFNIEHIPGCAELGDFDATSTAAAIVYCGELENLPQPAARNTFERYWRDLSSRLVPGARYVFTPYEARSILAFLFMEQKDRALALTQFLAACRRPTAWNHLAEVVHSEYRFPCYIGDMPHTWVGSEFIHSVRGLLLHEQGDALVVGAGIDPRWLEAEAGVFVRHAPTRFGVISFTMKKEGNAVRVHLSGDAHPRGGLVIRSPLDRPLTAASVNGKPVAVSSGNFVRIEDLPSDIALEYGFVR